MCLGKLIIAGMVSLACSATALGQGQAPSSTNISKDKIISEYNGAYRCAQGDTSLTLQFLRPEAGSDAVAIFKFGPSSSNQAVSSGAFLLRGTVNWKDGTLDLHPLSWLSQPVGYLMVGLSGRSNDGGKTFEGRVVGPAGCSQFSLTRTSVTPAARDQSARAKIGQSNADTAPPPAGFSDAGIFRNNSTPAYNVIF
jgi:hypothetical protein